MEETSSGVEHEEREEGKEETKLLVANAAKRGKLRQVNSSIWPHSDQEFGGISDINRLASPK